MNNNQLIGTNANKELAIACQKNNSNCCRKGKIFLPKQEWENIKNWVNNNLPEVVNEFKERTIPYPTFYLYDQRNGCQFLSNNGSCQLHNEGVKPTECFWWPIHVYSGKDGQMEIRIATTCCDGCQSIRNDQEFLEIVEKDAKRIGLDVIRQFRTIFPGGYHKYETIKVIKE
ncbi:MAG: hypothetical protein US31_C0006G0029 [Berkelbacteria bacterium GW2011_GWA1_36_9]|uniref:YkgJ family cysteine cluster protein n=1 Tax=Berkelbacteria bacterium GW2011_GWA1_36_9 TaxID=1618331 RepID=A0A0G0FGU5_9BACT|nr:MAG: hypothetical protein US31_C0006G0029 [Berkelbacteria bacterium GW2011_GWA1_36_9]